MIYPVEVENLTKKYPLVKRYREIILHPFSQKRMTALQDVSFHVNRGELFGLLGPNGAGKTTLLKVLAALILPDSGKVRINGIDVERKPMLAKQNIGFVVSEERSFYWRLTGWQNLEFFAVMNNISNHRITPQLNKVLNLVRLSEEAHRMFKDYSAGMKQRLAIARSLLTEPEILIMDEPTRSLDPSAARILKNFIKKLVEEQGKTVCLSTHNLSEAEELCGRIAILHKGRLRACDTPGNIKSILPAANLMEIHLIKNKETALKHGLKDICSSSNYKTAGIEEKGDGIRLALEVEKDIDISAIVKRFSDAGFKVSACIPREATLTEVFDKLVEQEK